jgi:hypothetical protein
MRQANAWGRHAPVAGLGSLSSVTPGLGQLAVIVGAIFLFSSGISAEQRRRKARAPA